jgi:hypothetical protein
MKAALVPFFELFLSSCPKSFGDPFWSSKFLSTEEAQKKWGLSKFVAEKFKTTSEKERGAMATDAIKQKAFVGEDMLNVRKTMGTPNSYFFSDTIYAYKITEPRANKESWQLIFVQNRYYQFRMDFT